MAIGKKRLTGAAAVLAALVAVPLLLASGAAGSAQKPALKLTAAQEAALFAAFDATGITLPKAA